MKLSHASVLSVFVFGFCIAGAARGEVAVSQSGGTLKLTGDAESDLVSIDGYGDLGEVGVILAGVPTPYFGVRDIVVNTGAGPDKVHVSGLQIGGSLKVKLGAGDDEFDLDDDSSGGPHAVFIGRDLDLSLGGQIGDHAGFDVVIGLTVIVGNNLVIRGAADVRFNATDDSSGSGVGDFFVCGNLRIETKVAQDSGVDGFTITLDDVNVGGKTLLDLGSGQDVVGISFCRFSGDFTAKLGGGDDFVDFWKVQSVFHGDLVLNGGAGFDLVEQYGNIYVVDPPKTKGIEVGP